ncbi:hypothetical protein HDC93_007523 [Streptomyces sp. AK010]|nr:hypothetical protein [Streptomyces sp. AK010]
MIQIMASWWHWFFLEQTDKVAERVIDAEPDAWYKATSERMGTEAYEDLRRAIHDPATVHALCEDQGAGLGVDREHDVTDHELADASPVPCRRCGPPNPSDARQTEAWGAWRGTGLLVRIR